MRKTLIILVILFGLFLASGVVSAFRVKPGMNIPLVLQDYHVSTHTPLVPDWKPEGIRWQLVSPSGDVKVVRTTGIDSIHKTGGGILRDTDWVVTTNGGFITVPAFAEPGEWNLNVVFFAKSFIFVSHKVTTVRTIQVEEADFADNLMAPVGVVFSIPFVGDTYLGLELIYIIGIIAIIPLIFLVVRRKKDV